MTERYVELHARSAFSFLEGASLPEAMTQQAANLELPGLAILDRDGLYGSPRLYTTAKKLGLRSHIGAEVSVDAFDKQRLPPSWQPHGIPSRPVRLSLLCESQRGYQNLSLLISGYKLAQKTKGDGVASFRKVEEHAEGLVCLTGGDEGPLAAALDRGGMDEGRLVLARLVKTFGQSSVYVELQRHGICEQEARNQAAISLAQEFQLPVLATNGVCMATEFEREILDVLTTIRHGCSLDEAGLLLQQNGKRHMRSAKEMCSLFRDVPAAIGNTAALSDRLTFQMHDMGYEFPRYPIPEGESMDSFLHKRTLEGVARRYGVKASAKLRSRAHQQVDKELALIAKLGLAGYFLIVWDIVEFCRKNGILVQGRGSAANSAVCYSLGITAVDPVGMELLFERFLSEVRGEWPDIDLDLPSGDDRERAIQYVYERYGQLGAAMCANVITYRGRSAAREVGKSLGFNADMQTRLTRLVGSWEWKGPTDTMEHQFREAGFDLHHPRIAKVSRTLHPYARPASSPRPALGRHDHCAEPACLRRANRARKYAGPQCRPVGQGRLRRHGPHQGRSTWVGDDGGSERLRGVDFALSRRRGSTSRRFPHDDPEVFDMLKAADTVGLFQVESRAQMASLPRNRPDKFYDHRGPGGDHPAGADCRSDDESVYGEKTRTPGNSLCASVAGTSAAPNAGRATVSRTTSKNRHGDRQFYARGGRGVASRPRKPALR